MDEKTKEKSVDKLMTFGKLAVMGVAMTVPVILGVCCGYRRGLMDGGSLAISGILNRETVKIIKN